MVMPEIGFDDEPIRPVMRDETVTKKKPKMIDEDRRQEVALRRHPRRDRQEDRQQQRSDRARRSSACRARCGASPAPPRPALKSFMLSRNDETIVGIVRASVMRPDASTAPAPV